MINKKALLLASLCTIGSLWADEVIVNRYRYAGPYEVRMPFEADSLDVNGKRFTNKELLRMEIPFRNLLQSGQTLEAAASGELSLPSASTPYALHLVSFYLNSDRYVKGSLSIQGPEVAEVYVDGKSLTLSKDEAELVLEDCVAGDYLDCEIPKLSIQPLVENAISHGLPSGHGHLHIRISCSNEAGWLKVCVENDGCGIPAERLAAIRRALDGGSVEPLRKERNGIGIVNVHQRLVMSYGEGSGLRLESGEAGGVRAYVILPYNGAELGGW